MQAETGCLSCRWELRVTCPRCSQPVTYLYGCLERPWRELVLPLLLPSPESMAAAACEAAVGCFGGQ